MIKKPICARCKTREGWIYINDTFVCGYCMNDASKEFIKIKEDNVILEAAKILKERRENSEFTQNS